MNTELKRVCILGSKGLIANAHNLSASQFLNACGQNTGNLLFQYACTKIFENISLGNIGHDIPYRHDHINNKHDFLILPCANFINPRFDMSGLVNYLKKTTIPIIPIGLGAQLESSSDRFPELTSMPESIQELIEVFRLSSPKIFVRGEFTKGILAKYGIDDDRISVIGCPSNFIGDEAQMRAGFEHCFKIADEDINLLVTGDEVWPKNPEKREAEKQLVSLLLKGGGGYLVQSVEPLIRNILGIKSSRMSNELSNIMKHIGFKGLADEPRSFLRLYDSVHAWMFGIRDISFSTGLRLHGNMCSLQCGIPAVWIHHDSRTEELCKTMALPSMPLKLAQEHLSKGNYVEVARSLAHKEMSKYFDRRRKLRSMFAKELSRIGIVL